MSVRVSHSSISADGTRKRWYVWKMTGGGWRKERLSSYVARMKREGNTNQVASVMAKAIRKGYKLSLQEKDS